MWSLNVCSVICIMRASSTVERHTTEAVLNGPVRNRSEGSRWFLHRIPTSALVRKVSVLTHARQWTTVAASLVRVLRPEECIADELCGRMDWACSRFTSRTRFYHRPACIIPSRKSKPPLSFRQAYLSNGRQYRRSYGQIIRTLLQKPLFSFA